MDIKILSNLEIEKKLQANKALRDSNYFAMYSSWFGGIIKDTAHMMVPVDDHMVHRGDGVFEAFRMVDGAFYLLMPHLLRLEQSAKMIDLPLSHTREELIEICKQTAKVSGQKSAIVRLYMSRGPGSFSPNPYDSVGSQLYVVIAPFKPVSEDIYAQGCTAKISQIPVKPAPFAQAKTCNYLPNVMMKKESLDGGYDFSISLTDEGYVAEGATANLFILSKDNILMVPPFSQTLKGTTLQRTLELAKSLVNAGKVSSIVQKNFHVKDLIEAKEVFMVGTTLEVLSIIEFEGKKISSGLVGEVSKALRDLLKADMLGEDSQRLLFL